MRLVFAGTPEFSVSALDALHGAGHEIVGVFTQPDRPAGRGRKLMPSPVAQRAAALGLPLYKPEKLRAEAQAELRLLAPEVMVVVAYGLILPQAVLDIPRLGAINIHASLLPRWRGAAPIQRALLAGDTATGVSLMQMDAGLDTGPVLETVTLPLQGRETSQAVHDALADLGAQHLPACLQGLEQGALTAAPQPEAGVTYAHKLDKAEARVDWTLDAASIDRAVRAFNPWPVAFSPLDDAPVRIWSAQPLSGMRSHAAPGAIVAANEAGIDVACADGVLRILELQFPGKRRLNAAEVVRGRPLRGQQFGS
ncbi:methionyl-tRNA formyltransferase [Sinimarinibacterium flocculans]|uniref:methionyl-tRNA formyltransferase n=1 Tax=Sinimarinibacterium flocculans TaxID=985250 RepID=UPI0035191038